MLKSYTSVLLNNYESINTILTNLHGRSKRSNKAFCLVCWRFLEWLRKSGVFAHVDVFIFSLMVSATVHAHCMAIKFWYACTQSPHHMFKRMFWRMFKSTRIFVTLFSLYLHVSLRWKFFGWNFFLSFTGLARSTSSDRSSSSTGSASASSESEADRKSATAHNSMSSPSADNSCKPTHSINFQSQVSEDFCKTTW